MELRLASKKDYDIFNEMYINLFVDDTTTCKMKPMPKSKYEELLKYEAIYFAVEDEEIPIGFAIIYAFEDTGVLIEQFFVKEKNKGHGSEFYKLIEEEIKNSCLNRIYLYAFWEKAERFWQRQGFHSVRGTEEYEKILN